jgi:hypothetical protein
MGNGMAYQIRDFDGEVQESSLFEQRKVLDRVTRGTAYQLRDLDGEVKESSVFEKMKVLDRGNHGNGIANRPWTEKGRKAVYFNR